MSAAERTSGLLAATLLLGACATPVALPPHVSTRSTEAGAYLDRVDLSYASPSPPDFARLKLCVAETISNDSVGLKDAVGSFVGVTGTYYQAQNQQTAGGGASSPELGPQHVGLPRTPASSFIGVLLVSAPQARHVVFNSCKDATC